MKKILFIISIVFLFAMCGENNTDNADENSAEFNSETNVSNPEKVVKLFVESLGKQNFQTAYNLQKNTAWGDFKKFSSTSSFGGINGTKINSIEQKPNEGDYSVISVDVDYSDPINGDNRFKQSFYLQKFGDDWKIVKMKVTKSYNNKNSNSSLDSFLALFKDVNLTISDKILEQNSKPIPEDLVKKFITKGSNPFNPEEKYTAFVKFKADKSHYGLIFESIGDNPNTYIYLFLIDDKGNYTDSKRISGEQLSGVGSDGTYYTFQIRDDLLLSIEASDISNYEKLGSTVSNFKIKFGKIIPFYD